MILEVVLDFLCEGLWGETMGLQRLDEVDDLDTVVLLEALRREIDQLSAVFLRFLLARAGFILVLGH